MLKIHIVFSLLRYIMKYLKNIFILSLLTATVAMGQKTYIHAGKLIDAVTDIPIQMVTIVVNDNVIQTVLRGHLKPGPKDRLIDLKDFTVLPGLMDMHTHLSGQSNPKSYMEKFYMDLDEYAYRSIPFAEKTLMAGFTTVRELGGVISNSLRDAINAGYVIGPRIYSAGKSIATTGGHADPSSGLNMSFAGDPGPKEGVINGPSDARKAVRQRYKNGADLIKITATGGVLSVAKNSKNPQFTEEEIRAIVETAEDYDMHVAAHAHGPEGMKRAIKAGVRTIEHGTIMDGEVLALMKKHGTYYVPTISAGMFVAEKAKESGYYPPIIVPKALEIGPRLLNTFTTAYKFGIKIAFGTDSGVSYHGDNAKEFVYMVEGGMLEIEAIKSATVVPAQLLNISEKFGTIESNKIADIIAVDGDPTQDIRSMLKVVFVMKNGKVYKTPS